MGSQRDETEGEKEKEGEREGINETTLWQLQSRRLLAINYDDKQLPQ